MTIYSVFETSRGFVLLPQMGRTNIIYCKTLRKHAIYILRSYNYQQPREWSCCGGGFLTSFEKSVLSLVLGGVI